MCNILSDPFLSYFILQHAGPYSTSSCSKTAFWTVACKSPATILILALVYLTWNHPDPFYTRKLNITGVSPIFTCENDGFNRNFVGFPTRSLRPRHHISYLQSQLLHFFENNVEFSILSYHKSCIRALLSVTDTLLSSCNHVTSLSLACTAMY